MSHPLDSCALMDEMRACHVSRVRARRGRLDSEGADRVRTAIRAIFAVE